MDVAKVEALLGLIEKAEVFPPDDGTLDPIEYEAVIARRQAIIAKANADIDAELLLV